MSGRGHLGCVVGEKYGRLTVVSRAGRTALGGALWNTLCDCGGSRVAETSKLRSKNGVKSCGCLAREARRHLRADGALKHGLTRTPTYRSWESMKSRCRTPTHTGYWKYGARGVTVCERWTSFENFLADMDIRPPGKTLDRKDPFGNYEPGNCRWATPTEQAANTRAKATARTAVEFLY